MKVYIVSEGKPNTGHECAIRVICATLELAEKIKAGFQYLGLDITEFEVIE